MEGLLQKEVGDLACVEVIDFNKKNEERKHSNDVHAKEKTKEREHQPSRKHSYPEILCNWKELQWQNRQDWLTILTQQIRRLSTISTGKMLRTCLY